MVVIFKLQCYKKSITVHLKMKSIFLMYEIVNNTRLKTYF